MLNKFQQIYDDLNKSMMDRNNNENGRQARCDLLTSQINQLKEEMKKDVEQKNQLRNDFSKDEEAINEKKRHLSKIIKKIDTNVKNTKQLEHDMSESSES